MKYELFNFNGDRVGDFDVDSQVFDVSGVEHAIWQTTRAQLATRRSGTHSSLRRSEVRGGGRKPYRQKGTGRARQGSTRSPQFVGGGGVFTPKPRSHAQRVSKKARALALCGVLSDCIRDKKLFVIDRPIDKPIAIADVLSFLKKVGLSSMVLVADTDSRDPNASLRIGNLQQVKVLPYDHVNLYDVLKYRGLVLSVEALKRLQDDLKRTMAS